MKNTKRLLAILSVGIAVSVSYTAETQGVMSLTPPETAVSKEVPRQEAKMVPFAKVMEPAFAEDYVDTDITTEVKFVTIARMPRHLNKYEKNKHITFLATPPGGGLGKYIIIPKDKSDPIFSAKGGDILTVIGRPMIEKKSYYVVFIATSAYKTGTEVHHKAQTQPIPENQPKTSQSSQQTQGDKKKASTDIPSDTAMRLERERALALGVGKKQQNDLGSIVATVNGENIYQKEVDKVLKRFETQVSQEQIPAATKQILDGLVTQKLIMQFVRDNKIQVNKADIDAELNKVREDIKSNPALAGQTLEQVLEKHGGSIEDMKNDITMFLSMEKYLSKNGLDDKRMSPQDKQKIIEERGQLLVKQLREKANIDIK